MANVVNVIPILETPSRDHFTDAQAMSAANKDAKRIEVAVGALRAAMGEGSGKILKHMTGSDIGQKPSGEYVYSENPGQVVVQRAHPDTIFRDYAGKQEAAIKLTLEDKGKTDILIPVTPANITKFEQALQIATAEAKKLNVLLGTQLDNLEGRENAFDTYQGPIHQILKTELKAFIR